MRIFYTVVSRRGTASRTIEEKKPGLLKIETKNHSSDPIKDSTSKSALLPRHGFTIFCVIVVAWAWWGFFGVFDLKIQSIQWLVRTSEHQRKWRMLTRHIPFFIDGVGSTWKITKARHT